MVVKDKQQLIEQCQTVLTKNQHGNYTIPAENLYPHQWLWDSCFIAIGLAHYDIERAQKEILSLLRGQWANGMLPHMIFADGDQHRRDRVMWQSWRNPFSPDNVSTSGITQPPMLAEAIVRIGKQLETEERRQWYMTVYPALLAYHEWLYKERDPHEEGLVLLVHPWECGLDNSPPWIHELQQNQRPWWIRIIQALKLDKLINLVRRDTLHVAPGERLSNVEALAYYSVLVRLRRKNWDTSSILARSHFTVQDLTFNCILIRAHDHLKSIAKLIGHEVPDWLNERNKKAKTVITERLWDGFSGEFYSRNFITHKLIKETSIATFMPLYAGCLDKEQAELLIKLLKNKKHFWGNFPIPSVPFSSDYYSELGYWQGPAWLNTNWLIIDGLKRYGHQELAEEIRLASIDMVRQSGCYEYFSAKDASPAGAKNFSWTASLAIDLLHS